MTEEERQSQIQQINANYNLQIQQIRQEFNKKIEAIISRIQKRKMEEVRKKLHGIYSAN